MIKCAIKCESPTQFLVLLDIKQYNVYLSRDVYLFTVNKFFSNLYISKKSF